MRKVTREPSGDWRPIEEEMVCDGWLARARGYSGSRDRAREMARTALVALQKAEAGT
jgi:hypothetical protein